MTGVILWIGAALIYGLAVVAIAGWVIGCLRGRDPIVKMAEKHRRQEDSRET